MHEQNGKFNKEIETIKTTKNKKKTGNSRAEEYNH